MGRQYIALEYSQFATMISGKLCLCLLLLAKVVVSDESSQVLDEKPVLQFGIALKNQSRFDELVGKLAVALGEIAAADQQVAYLNEWVDEILPNANAYLIESEYDPIDIEGVDSGFSWGLFSGWVKFTDGLLNGLGTLERKGDVTLTYEYPNLQLKVPIGFSRLQFFYNYEIKFIYIGPTGIVEGKSSNNKITLDINLDMITLMAKLNKFTVNTMGSISLVFRGSILTDWLLNTVVFTVTPIIKLILSGVVESFVGDTLVVLLNVYNDTVCALLENCTL